MKIENNIKNNEVNAFTIRMDSKMQQMVEQLTEKKLLNKTAIIRLAIAEMYEREVKGVINND